MFVSFDTRTVPVVYSSKSDSLSIISSSFIKSIASTLMRLASGIGMKPPRCSSALSLASSNACSPCVSSNLDGYNGHRLKPCIQLKSSSSFSSLGGLSSWLGDGSFLLTEKSVQCEEEWRRRTRDSGGAQAFARRSHENRHNMAESKYITNMMDRFSCSLWNRKCKVCL